jgi:hypothetical protein
MLRLLHRLSKRRANSQRVSLVQETGSKPSTFLVDCNPLMREEKTVTVRTP